MRTRGMRIQVLGWGLLSPWVVAFGIAAPLSGCDDAQQDDDVSFRADEFDDDSAGGLPEPAATAVTKGAPVSGCPDCGSHWTVVGENTIVHLAKEVGDGVLDLSKIGDVFYLGGYGTVDPTEAQAFGDGYSILVRSRAEHASDALEPDYIFPRRAVVRFEHEGTPVDVRLRFFDSETKLSADPPGFE